MRGLPDTITACLFDLDGVLTKTADLHRAAWKETFDQFLQHRDATFVPFDANADYAAYVDGKKREDGVRDFLASRAITLPEGDPGDPPGDGTVHGVGNRKNVLLLSLIRRDGVKVYDGSRRFVDAARKAGLRCAVVSSSANTEEVLNVTGLAASFETRIDGVVARKRSLPGKPAPDTFLEAASELGVPAHAAAVFEDALAGVAAGRAGHFGYVIGVDRLGQADALRAHGADIVVQDLEELL
ncbi:HAD superfamily hydrolase (TIGR01509 family)/beta-phosphoglucomutase family hydrolase [Antricoccus suffuscus]|uniref:Beta-phosphoglucomutase n=1 Tax=Antricoccus suffuscus TaxID=1629062 RepID=A0A2T0ZWQ2_9ACTN|nr:beta-phosphoglucomutase family hydrolase [Antricoccus suffuscus]PRZ40776.1 HAD superfamily hydrolase (TIGR01509 family)/beta-phosphoglucomutase family hydrolase [Antricoccus suffuscus]